MKRFSLASWLSCFSCLLLGQMLLPAAGGRSLDTITWRDGRPLGPGEPERSVGA